jgi:hypothetical protein
MADSVLESLPTFHVCKTTNFTKRVFKKVPVEEYMDLGCNILSDGDYLKAEDSQRSVIGSAA